MFKLSDFRTGGRDERSLTCGPRGGQVLPMFASLTGTDGVRGGSVRRALTAIGAIVLLAFTATYGVEAQRASGRKLRIRSSADSSHLVAARYAMGVVKAKDGKIYAIGGGSEHGALNSVEVLDPTSDSKWTLLPAPLNTARYGLAATIGPDGKIYAIGGVSGDFKILDTVEVYDPASSEPQWITLSARLFAARKGLAATTGLDGKIYAIGGGGNYGPLDSVEILDPTEATPHWTRLAASLNTARQDFAAVTGLDGKIYVLGGYAERGKALDSVEALDAAASHWSVLPASLPEARYAHAATVAADGKIYAVGGRIGATVPIKRQEINTNPAAGTVAGQDPTGTYDNRTSRRVRVDRPLDRNLSLDTVTVYDPSAPNPHWTRLSTPLAIPRERLGVVPAPDGKILAIGGVDLAIQPLASVETYDPGARESLRVLASH